jgi:hypothetical protein
MNPWIIGLLIFYALAIVTYIFSQHNKKRLRWQVINKIVLASTYLLLATIAIIRRPISIQNVMLLSILIFCWFGDILLRKYFVLGGLAFTMANFLSITYLILLIISRTVTYSLPIAIISFIIFYGLFVVGFVTKFIDISQLKVFAVYIVTITVAGAIGLSMITTNITGKYLLTAIGYLLFMISDYDLAIYTFRPVKTNLCHTINSLTYFPAVMLLALTTVL